MKRFLLLLFIILLSFPVFSKGKSGVYYIAGIVYGSDKKPLKNIPLTITIGNSKQKKNGCERDVPDRGAMGNRMWFTLQKQEAVK